jgi:uncharacterized FlaG/YvyC family protein
MPGRNPRLFFCAKKFLKKSKKGVDISRISLYNDTRKREEHTEMTEELIKRMNKAMEQIGGTLGFLNLPEQVKDIVVNCNDYETRVKMLELCVEQLNKR